jgi:hypothetical protein
VKPGTTNTGSSIVPSDISVRGGDQPVIEVTGANNDLTIENSWDITGVRFTCPDRLTFKGKEMRFTSCEFNCDNILSASLPDVIMDDCYLEVGNDGDVGSGIALNVPISFTMNGGAIVSASAHNYFLRSSGGLSTAVFNAVDLSGLSVTYIANTFTEATVTFYGCQMPSSYTLAQTSATNKGSIRLISCGVSSSKANDENFHEYEEEQAGGTIDTEVTAIRTGGADTGYTSGGFSRALTPNTSETLEGTYAHVRCPRLVGTVDGGSSKTFTIYIANSGAGDYNEDEAFAVLYIPDPSDTNQYKRIVMTITNDSLDHITESGTAITDDASTWGTGAGNAQKFVATATPGYSGPVYADVFFAKRFTSSPETLYVDPVIHIT